MGATVTQRPSRTFKKTRGPLYGCAAPECNRIFPLSPERSGAFSAPVPPRFDIAARLR